MRFSSALAIAVACGLALLIGCGGKTALGPGERRDGGDAGELAMDAGCRDGLACDGTCVDPLTSDSHCGGCGNACETDEGCEEGSCVARGLTVRANWARALGRQPNGAQFVELAIDGDGNVYVSGDNRRTDVVDYGVGITPTAELGTSWVASYSPRGELRWRTPFVTLDRIPLPGKVAIFDVDAGPGCVAVGGQFERTVDFGVAVLTTLDAPTGAPGAVGDGFVACLDPTSGRVIWVQPVGALGTDSVFRVAVSSDGSVAATGAFGVRGVETTLRVGSTELVSDPAAIYSHYVVAFHRDGSLVWSRYVPALVGPVYAADDQWIVIALAQHGLDFGGGLVPPTTLARVAIVSYGRTGAFRWQALGSEHSFYASARYAGDTILLVGAFAGPRFDLGRFSLSREDDSRPMQSFIASLDLDGTVTDLVPVSAAAAVGVLGDGSWVIAGTVDRTIGARYEGCEIATGDRAGFVVALDHDRRCRWGLVLDSNPLASPTADLGADRLHDVEVDPEGRILFVGAFDRALDIADQRVEGEAPGIYVASVSEATD